MLWNIIMLGVTKWNRQSSVNWLVYVVPSHYNTINLWQITTFVSLTHWGQVMNICISKLSIIGSDNGLLPGRRQAIIIWTNAGILLNGP